MKGNPNDPQKDLEQVLDFFFFLYSFVFLMDCVICANGEIGTSMHYFPW